MIALAGMVWMEKTARLALSVVVFLVLLGVLRGAPAHAVTPLRYSGFFLVAVAALLAIVCALIGRSAGSGRAWFLPAIASALLFFALTVMVALRGHTGLHCEVRSAHGHAAWLQRGPVDVVRADLGSVAPRPRYSLHWSGSLRVPRSGVHRLWLEGAGSAELKLDGALFLWADGHKFRVVSARPLGAGEHQIEIRLGWTASNPRLRLGWTDGRDAHGVTIPARFLGPEKPRAVWALIDALGFGLALALAWLVFSLPWHRRRFWPSAQRAAWREIFVATIGLSLIVAVMSWPLVLDLAHRGSVHLPDGRLNAWILAWDVHALLHHPTRLFQCPIFHPLPDALAFSENLLIPAVIGAPALLLGGPVLAFNLLLLGGYVASGLGAHLLVRRVSGDRLASFVAGAIFAAGAHRWMNMSHLHAQFTVFMPFSLLALDRFAERRTLGRALVVGALLALQGASSVYLGAITAAFLAVAMLVGFLGGWRAREALYLGLALLFAAAALTPLVRPYMRMRTFQGEEFRLSTVAAHATTPESYLASASRLYEPLTQRHLDPDRVHDYLFPGFVPLLLGLAGLAAAPRRYRAVALLASVIAVTISFGPLTPFYRFLHEHVVLVRGLRALARFSLVPMMSLAVCAGLALSGRRRAFVVLALAGALVESAFFPLRHGRYEKPSPAARWLSGGEGPVAVLPLGVRDTDAMLDGIAHFRPLVNGDSGFVPRPYRKAIELFSGRLTDDGQRLLRALGVRHVVLEQDCELPLAARFDHVRIYEVGPGDEAQAIYPGAPLSARATPQGDVVDLGSDRMIDRIVFALENDPWMVAPRLAHSLDGVSWNETEGRASLADATLSLYRDPRQGYGEIRFTPVHARFLRIDPLVPVRDGIFFESRHDRERWPRSSQY
ncbi:MAG: hypothetical protein JXO72_03295 [Vicinamibacteria bacterium]|nr:hypothetical protein [Vicinamibacteria bacterium]